MVGHANGQPIDERSTGNGRKAIGTGDAFVAGLAAGLMEGRTIESAVKRGLASAKVHAQSVPVANGHDNKPVREFAASTTGSSLHRIGLVTTAIVIGIAIGLSI